MKHFFKEKKSHDRHMKPVARLPHDDSSLCCLIWGLGSRHLVLYWELLENSNLLVVVRDPKVKDWLWLGKVLAPLTHPTWGKLLYNLIWFENLKYSSNSKTLILQLLNLRIYINMFLHFHGKYNMILFDLWDI